MFIGRRDYGPELSLSQCSTPSLPGRNPANHTQARALPARGERRLWDVLCARLCHVGDCRVFAVRRDHPSSRSWPPTRPGFTGAHCSGDRPSDLTSPVPSCPVPGSLLGPFCSARLWAPGVGTQRAPSTHMRLLCGWRCGRTETGSAQTPLLGALGTPSGGDHVVLKHMREAFCQGRI